MEAEQQHYNLPKGVASSDNEKNFTKIFLSYSRKDSDFAKKFATDLRNKGFNIWIDQYDLRSGKHFDSEIQVAIADSECLMAILSNTSVCSNNVLDEISCALDEGKVIIPIIIQDCKVPLRLSRLQYNDFRKDYNTALAVLLEELNIKRAAFASNSNQPGRSTRFVNLKSRNFILGALLITFLLVMTTINYNLLVTMVSDNSTVTNSVTPNVGKAGGPSGTSLKDKDTTKDRSKPVSVLPNIKSTGVANTDRTSAKTRDAAPLIIGNSNPVVRHWKIYDKSSKTAYKVLATDTPLIVTHNADLEIACDLVDAKGIRDTDIFANVSSQCNEVSFRSRQVDGHTWKNNDVAGIRKNVITVIHITLVSYDLNPCEYTNQVAADLTGAITVYFSAHNSDNILFEEVLKIKYYLK